jgi:hypothetical protein
MNEKIYREVIESQNEAIKLLIHAIDVNATNHSPNQAQIFIDAANVILQNCTIELKKINQK